ncbi:hypothetical protein LMG7141_00913 [Ralstonia condita]|jgi:ribosomal subunit interface protein|uniref:Ribosomal subunit interface protein n=1 Tax=Ralstonia condita TaxID=3058600 RepID=A0ABN9IHY4_9RALS|nr:hypothetical protein LMG7141_00913 [Ralstonia sp. LMG 7141]
MKLLDRADRLPWGARQTGAACCCAACSMEFPVTIPVDISFQGLPHSKAVEDAITHQITRLERLRSHITRCRVSLVQTARHQQQGRPFTVHVDVTTPLSDHISSTTAEEDPYLALREAFSHVERMLVEAAQRQHPGHGGRAAGQTESA